MTDEDLVACEDRLASSYSPDGQENMRRCEICDAELEKTRYDAHLAAVHFCSFGSGRRSRVTEAFTEALKCLKCKYMVHYRDRMTNIKIFRKHFINNHPSLIDEKNNNCAPIEEYKGRDIYDVARDMSILHIEGAKQNGLALVDSLNAVNAYYVAPEDKINRAPKFKTSNKKSKGRKSNSRKK
jgi:hypothetical protein